jgi:multidrug resistance efflux pump
MKYLLGIFILAVSLNATVYYAKVEPYEVYHVKASASGSVILVFKEAEGRVSNGGILIQIDDFLNKKELESSKKKLEVQKRSYVLLEKNIQNSKKVEEIRKDNYNRIKNLKTKSKISKDAELINLINATNQVISLENSLQNLQVTISDLEYKIAYLEDTIKKKRVKIKKGFLIYKVYVSEGDFVGIGAPLVDAYDITKGRVVIYLSSEDVDIAKDAVLYVNDKPTKYKISKVWKVADSNNISSYRAEIIVDAPKHFSRLFKIELKKK